MLLQEISRNYIHIQHQGLNFLWFKKKWVVDVVAPTIFSYTNELPSQDVSTYQGKTYEVIAIR
jgi:hypothetical protein